MIHYHKRGGLHFVTIGRFGFNFYRRKKPSPRVPSHLFTMIDTGIRDIVLIRELTI